jgi:replication initiation protein RepC
MNKHAAGLRKSSPESLGGQKLARKFREGIDVGPAVSRTGALRVAKRAAAAMGLKAAKIALIDQLFAASKPGDWGVPGSAPIVWPSNASLAHNLGVSISTLKHHLNGLVKARLITYSDHPTYQRRGRRDASGKIVEAYGIDLSPIAVRFAELTEMVEAAEYQAREWKRHSYRRTVLRKEIQSLILSATQHRLPGPWSHHQARLDVLREQRPAGLDELIVQVEGLEGLLEAVEKAYQAGFEEQNFDSAVSKFRPLQTTAESLNPEESNSNSKQRRANARQIFSKEVYDHSTERKSDADSQPQQSTKLASRALEEDVQFISLPLMQSACPAVEQHVPGAFANWRTLREAGWTLCVSVGINPQVWQEAVGILGPDVAVAAVAVTVQKLGLGTVTKPGAYLRTLAQRGRDGKLHISRSLFALAKSGQDADIAVDAASFETPEFPATGSITYTSWQDVVRKHAPAPTPDSDTVARAFRGWAKTRGIDLTAPNIEKVFAGFCRKWRVN